MLHLLSALLDALDLSQRQALSPYHTYIVGVSAIPLSHPNVCAVLHRCTGRAPRLVVAFQTCCSSRSYPVPETESIFNIRSLASSHLAPTNDLQPMIPFMDGPNSLCQFLLELAMSLRQ
ncbi:hypothetical protein BDV24DRAFT_154730 [Aspergillus arachidicola]|uniref:Uncharacterized protein n=1 Tax=Aspergillus arachidicola TaxID=656916 RepID=A0A5N6XWL9_9EURO|nr:hypothetical protein BDV24DRAFT_154730 [Aspergillus arachidicola]